jgi:hypothetical protein
MMTDWKKVIERSNFKVQERWRAMPLWRRIVETLLGDYAVLTIAVIYFVILPIVCMMLYELGVNGDWLFLLIVLAVGIYIWHLIRRDHRRDWEKSRQLYIKWWGYDPGPWKGDR